MGGDVVSTSISISFFRQEGEEAIPVRFTVSRGDGVWRSRSDGQALTHLTVGHLTMDGHAEVIADVFERAAALVRQGLAELVASEAAVEVTHVPPFTDTEVAETFHVPADTEADRALEPCERGEG